MSTGSPELAIEGAIATITLCRPAQANSLTSDDVAHLTGLLAEVNARPEVLVLMLRSSGKHFSSGYDIGSIGSTGSERPVDFAGMVDAVELARPVTLAVLHGGVYGGATDLALACDFRLGAEGIDMFMPAARLGLHFYQRGMERYVSRLGIDTAKRLFLAAEKIDAREMKAVGFLTHLVPAGQLQPLADQLATTLSGMAPLALLGMKKHLNRIARGTVDVLELQKDIGRAYTSTDLKEGQSAWAEKRAPRFTGR